MMRHRDEFKAEPAPPSASSGERSSQEARDLVDAEVAVDPGAAELVELKRRLGQMAELEDLGRSMHKSLCLDEVVTVAVEGFAHIFEPDLIMVFLNEGERLMLRGLRSGFDAADADGVALLNAAERFCRFVSDTGEGVVSRDFGGDSGAVLQDGVAAGEVCVVALPLSCGGQTLGVLGLVPNASCDIDEQWDLMDRAASQLAIAVHNAVRYGRLGTTLRSLSDLILQVDADGLIHFLHCILPQLLWCKPEEVAGKRVDQVFVGEVADRITQSVAEAQQTAAPTSTICSVKMDDGPVWLELHVVPGGGAGRGALFTLHARDITELMLTEEDRYLLSTAVEQSTDGVLITEIDGTIRYVNAAFEKITGYPREAVIGKNPRLLKSGEQTDDFYKELWNTLLQGKVWTGHFVNRRADQTLNEVDAAIYPICDAEGRAINFVAVKRDVTEAMALERRTLQARKMEAVGQFASRIAHDFNNLLMVIQGTLELLKQRARDDHELAKRLEIIGRAASDGTQLTSSLLAFSRRQDLDLQDSDLNEVIEGVLPMLERLVPSGVSIRLDLGSGRLGVRCDQTLIKQVLLNLCSNAADAMPDDGEMRITTGHVRIDGAYVREHPWSCEGPYVFVSVADEGEGMDEQTQAKVLDPFFTTKAPGEGTGLGLASAYGTVKQHQGMIDISSEPGIGTTVVVYLPATGATTATATSVPEAQAFAHVDVPTTGGVTEGTILVVEDQTDLLSVMVTFLRSQGYEILAAGDGVEALQTLQRGEGVRLVVTDVTMPRMDGDELYRRSRELLPNIQFLFCTGDASQRERMACCRDPRVAFLEKPFDIETLAAKVRSVLQQGSGEDNHD